MSEPYRLRPDEVFFSVDPEVLRPLFTAADGPGGEAEEIIGQPRALKALRMGTELTASGFNLVVSGNPGTGRHTAIRSVLAELPPDPDSQREIAYVHNFRRPEEPRVLYFPPCRGRLFKERLHGMIEGLKSAIPASLGRESYIGRRDALLANVDREESLRLAEFEALLEAEGFTSKLIDEAGNPATDIVPIFDGSPRDFEELQARVAAGEMSREIWDRLRERYYRLLEQMRALYAQLKIERRGMEEELARLRRDEARPVVRAEIEALLAEFEGNELREYLTTLEEDILEHLFVFTAPSVEEAGEGSATARILPRYGVNLLTEVEESGRPPVIFESNPSAARLVGGIEYGSDWTGGSGAGYLSVRAGSLLKASGGYLVLYLDDLLEEEGAWTQLKRYLKTGTVAIHSFSATPALPLPQLKPEPAEARVKLILIAEEGAYDLLYGMDGDFPKYFKISAEFDSSMDLSPGAVASYFGFVRRRAAEAGFLPVVESGLAGILAYGAFLAEQRDKLSTQFSLVADLLTEADYWARKSGRSEIDGEAVGRALDERRYLFNLPEEKLEELIIQGDILMQLSGRSIGRVNGLAIHDRGYYAFGMPTLISARIAPGEEGLINIEREVGLSGEIHDKWVLILDGYLRSRYALDFPLSMYATVCFEQSYSEIDGDSASSTEMYALLSAAGRLPLRQDIAVTGSMNQMGDVQPVGGISEKITGFFSVCRKTGLTGTQGVIIPDQNRKNLFLSAEIRDAVETGSFHIYPVTTIDQGMEILTGLPAGTPGRNGRFPANTVNGRIERELRGMALLIKQFNN